MDKHESPRKDQAHKPIDPSRSAARENRTPGKDYQPRRSESDAKPQRKNRKDE
jgi:hypothetical protein